MTKYLLVTVLLLIGGCGQYSISNIDKPPPEDYETWIKQGKSQLQIKRALLECGAIAPSTLGWAYEKAYEKTGIIERKDQLNYGSLVDKCMINAGFAEQNTSWTLKDRCTDPRYRDIPACQPDTVIPKPSVERRLNSWYCKIERDYDYCLKNALAPQLCSPNDVKSLPPECLADEEEQLRGTQSNQPSKQTKFTKPTNTDTTRYRNNEQAMQLQRDIQNQNNRRMNEMLKNLQ